MGGERSGFEHGSAGTVCGKLSSGQAVRSTAVDGEGGSAEQGLEGPAAGEVKANTAGGLANASSDFKELGAQRFDLGRTPGLGQLQAEEVDQVVGEAVQQQAEGVGQEAVTAQAVGAETVLELLDAVLTLAAIVVESKDLRGTTGAVGNHEAQVGSDGGVFGLVTDAALARPTAGTVAEAGKAALREVRVTIAPLQLFRPRFGTLLEDAVRGDAEGVLDAEELAELVQQRQSKTGIAAQLDLHAGEGRLQTRHQAQQQGHDAGMTGGVSRTQPRSQQASGVALEDQHGVIHVLVVGAVEEAELLLAVGGIVGGIDIQQDLTALANLVATETNELLPQQVVQVYQLARGRRVLPAAESRLRA